MVVVVCWVLKCNFVNLHARKIVEEYEIKMDYGWSLSGNYIWFLSVAVVV